MTVTWSTATWGQRIAMVLASLIAASFATAMLVAALVFVGMTIESLAQ